MLTHIVSLRQSLKLSSIFNSHLQARIYSLSKVYPEVVLFLAFVGGNLLFDTFRLYLVLVGIIYLLHLLVFDDLIEATWYSFFSVFLFHKTKNFTSYYGNPNHYLTLVDEAPNITYSVSFSDGLLLILLYFILVRNRKIFTKFKTVRKTDFLVSALVVAGTIATVFSSMAEVSGFWLLQFVKYIVFFYLARLLGSYAPRIIKKTTLLFLVFCVLSAGLVFLQRYSGSPLGLKIESTYSAYGVYGKYADEARTLYRPGGLYWDPNLTASILGLALPILVVYSFTKQKKLTVYSSRLALVLVVMALVFTASRAVWVISAAVVFILVKLLRDRKMFVWPRFPQSYLALGVVMALIVLGPFIFNRLQSIGQTFDQRGGLQYRLSHIWLTADLLSKKPLGLGPNIFQYAVLDAYEPDVYFNDSTPAHNLLAEVGGGFGVLGLGVFLLLLTRICIDMRHHILLLQKSNAKYFLLPFSLVFLLASYLLNSQFYPWLFSPVISGIVWMFLGFAYAQVPRQKA